MEKIAVTFWKGLVSPLFDAAEQIMIDSPNGTRTVLDTTKMSIYQKTGILAEQKVRVLICGAISNIAAAALAQKNIAVRAWIRGNVDDVITAFRSRTLHKEIFIMPGARAGRSTGSPAATS